ncbi:hypothetical protein GQ53DRAFT_853627 [Thozetella sp. PMI_491]|nr:hypothetical protein GQ53DRAFT_853627 [Thozetella sp. PMI_491]
MARFSKLKVRFQGLFKQTTDRESKTDDRIPFNVTSAAEIPTYDSSTLAEPAETPSTTTIIVQSSPKQPESSVLLLSESTLWMRAFDLFQQRKPKLAAKYKDHLATPQDDNAADVNPSTPWSIELVVRRLLEKRKEKQWKIPLPGKDINIRKQVERLAKFLLWSDPIVQKALTAQPYAQLAWSGVSLLLPLLTSGMAQHEAMLKGFNSIGDLQMYWRIYEKIYLQPDRQHDPRLLDAWVKLYSHIIGYQAAIICHLSDSQHNRALKDVTNSEKWEGKSRDINDLDKICRDLISAKEQGDIRQSRDLQLQRMQQSIEVQENILKTMKDIHLEGKKAKIFETLAKKGGNYEWYKNNNPQRVLGTCEWFLNDNSFQAWRDSETSGILWVSAQPGCGKSVLSRTLIDEPHLAEEIATISITPSAIMTSTGPSSTVCYFFFKEGRMDGTNALCAILHQLFTRSSTSGLIEHALPTQQQNGETLAQKFSELWHILVECANASDAGSIICVLDALDECEEKSRDEILQTLRTFYSSGAGLSASLPRLKFLITGRPYGHLVKSFKTFSATACIHLDADEKFEVITKEINAVINYKVPRIMDGFTPDEQQQVLNYLKSRRNSTYLWLHLIFDMIEKSDGEYDRLSDVEGLLSSLPFQMSDVYEKILSRTKHPERTKILLEIVLAAERPLTLDEANTALISAVEKQGFPSHHDLKLNQWPKKTFRNTVSGLCGLFISVYDSRLFFIHETAREFLTHPKRKGTWEGRFNMSKSHSTMSLICLHYLLLPDLSLSKQGSSDGQEYSFLPYTAIHWPLHFISQESAIAEKSRQDARKLCNVSGEQARLWMPQYFEQSYPYWSGWTDLTLASHLNLLLVVEDILAKERLDIDGINITYCTPLQAALAEGHKEIVKLLVSKGANVNAEDEDYGTVLQAASAKGYKEIVNLLVAKGADINAEGRPYGTALQAALSNGHKEIPSKPPQQRAIRRSSSFWK